MNMLLMLVTDPVSHRDISPLNNVQTYNIKPIYVTDQVSQRDRSRLIDVQPQNIHEGAEPKHSRAKPYVMGLGGRIKNYKKKHRLDALGGTVGTPPGNRSLLTMIGRSRGNGPVNSGESSPRNI